MELVSNAIAPDYRAVARIRCVSVVVVSRSWQSKYWIVWETLAAPDFLAPDDDADSASFEPRQKYREEPAADLVRWVLCAEQHC